MDELLDAIGAALLLAGAFFSFAAALGVVRFPDVLSRMHAATKPQVFGLVLVVAGVGVSLRTPAVIAPLLLVVIFQVLTAPVAGHMVARAAYRSQPKGSSGLVVDELAEDLEAGEADGTLGTTDRR